MGLVPSGKKLELLELVGETPCEKPLTLFRISSGSRKSWPRPSKTPPACIPESMVGLATPRCVNNELKLVDWIDMATQLLMVMMRKILTTE
jgi:hypothetical protein